MNFEKEEQKKITDQDKLTKQSGNKGFIRFISISISLAMIAYTTCMCLQKVNKYSNEPKNKQQIEEPVKTK